MLSRWRKEYRVGKFKNVPRYQSNNETMSKFPTKKELDNIRKLKKENERLKQENDLLKKWQRYLAEVQYIRTIWIHPKIRTSLRCKILVFLA